MLTSSPVDRNEQAQLVEGLDRSWLNILDVNRFKPWWFLVGENAQLTQRLNGLQSQVDAQNAQTIAKFDTIQTTLNALNAQLNTLQTTVTAQTARLNTLETTVTAQNARLNTLETTVTAQTAQLNTLQTTVTAQTAQLNTLQTTVTAQTARLNTLETTVTTQNAQIGTLQADVAKLKNKVHFYVQRNTNFATANAVIPFQSARLNEGSAFDLPSGTFTAPVNGIYHFDFSALKDQAFNYAKIYLRVNGANVGIAHTNQGATGAFDSISLSASLRLVAGDTVNLFNEHAPAGTTGGLFDDARHFTHFTGWLVMQD